MPCWKNADRWRLIALAALAGIALAGCDAGRSGSLTIGDVQTPPFQAPELILQVTLPDTVRDGLQSGVALSFRLDLELDGDRLDPQWRELRYLPLTRQFQLREPASGYSRGFASRAAALAALESWPLPARAAGAQVAARVRLDSTRLPAPLVLPAVFDGEWRLDSGMTQWPAASR